MLVSYMPLANLASKFIDKNASVATLNAGRRAYCALLLLTAEPNDRARRRAAPQPHQPTQASDSAMSFWSQKTAAIGQKKYGLVKKQGSALQPQSAAVAALFGGADDDDQPRDQKKEVAQQMRDLGAAQRKRAAQQAAQAAAVDPSIYDYDGVYDQMKADERKKISARSGLSNTCLLYTSPSPRDGLLSRMPSSA